MVKKVHVVLFKSCFTLSLCGYFLVCMISLTDVFHSEKENLLLLVFMNLNYCSMSLDHYFISKSKNELCKGGEWGS